MVHSTTSGGVVQLTTTDATATHQRLLYPPCEKLHAEGGSMGETR